MTPVVGVVMRSLQPHLIDERQRCPNASRTSERRRTDSDYDVGLFLHDWTGYDWEVRRLAEIETDLVFATGTLVNTLPPPAAAYDERTALMSDIHREGLAL